MPDSHLDQSHGDGGQGFFDQAARFFGTELHLYSLDGFRRGCGVEQDRFVLDATGGPFKGSANDIRAAR